MTTLSSSRELSRKSFLTRSGAIACALGSPGFAQASNNLAAAIAIAFFDATGVRLYRAPMIPADARSQLKAFP